MSACLAEEELLALGRGASGRSLADAPEAEAHLARCAACSALLAAIARDDAPAAWDALAGAALGPYRLEAQIGAGGMGAVYRAVDTRLGRAVAVKVLHRGAGVAEARAAAAIAHPSIVAIHDAGVADGVAYIAMELVDGESMRSLVERGPLPLERVRALTAELARGLAAAHARGVIHRDLKPENLLVTRDGRLKILDFGLAKLADPELRLDETAPGTVQGTAGYMAPEQARGEPADARADLFAAGAIAYELATGRRAFDGATHADRLSAVLRDEPPLDGAGPLAPILARCLAKDPRDRFHSAADLAWALDAISAAAPAPAITTTPASTPDLANPITQTPTLDSKIQITQTPTIGSANQLTPLPARARRAPSRRAVLAGGAAAALTGAAGFLLGRRGRPRAPAAAPPLEYRPLTHRAGRVFTARFVPDGGRLIYGAAWETDPLAVHALDLASFEDTALDLPAGDVLAVSRRGELAVSLGRRFTEHQSSTGALAVVPLAGGAPRPLLENIEEADYAPDGALAAVRRHPGGSALELPLGTPLLESPGWITHARVSPDGARLAYVEHASPADDEGALRVLDLSRPRAPRTLGGAWASIAGLAWDPTGAALWFTASRAGAASALHRIAVTGGEPALIARATDRLRLHDVAADHRAAITVDTWRLRSIVGGPGREPADRSRSDMSLVTDLSADGASLLIGELGDTAQAATAYLVPVDGGRPLRVGPGLPYAVSPSGARVVAAVQSTGEQLVVYATTSADHAALAGPGPITAARWLDESSLVAAGAAPGARPRLWRLSPGAAPTPLTAEGLAGPMALDPPRRRCAFVDRRGALHVLDVATGSVATLPGDFRRRVACGWLDRDAIVLRSSTTPLELTTVDPATGASAPYLTIPTPLLGLKSVDSLVLRGDGSLYAYSYGYELSRLFLTTLP